MQDTAKPSFITILLVGVFLMGCVIFLFFSPTQSKVKVYDCSLAEISPDYPVEVKNECRKVRAEKIKESLQKPK